MSFPETIRPGALIRPDDQPNPDMSGWRVDRKPAVQRSLCVDCLLCWAFCPDAAVAVQSGHFSGFHYPACKGCEICVATCPTQAISMVPEATPVGPRGEMGGKRL